VYAPDTHNNQVADIRTIKDAMREASQLYTELVRVGAAMGMLDVGGGLGVDYDGSQGGEVSVNYSMQNYANDVVAIMNDACLQKGVRTIILTRPQPSAFRCTRTLKCSFGEPGKRHAVKGSVESRQMDVSLCVWRVLISEGRAAVPSQGGSSALHRFQRRF